MGVIKHQSTTFQHLHIASNRIIPGQLERGASVEGEDIAAVAQRSILHTHCGTRTFHGGDTPALVDSPLLHAQSPTIKVSQGIHLCGAGESYFLRRTGYIVFHGVQVIHRGRTGEDDIALLSLTLVRLIQLEATAFPNVNGIPEGDTLPRCGRKRYLSTTTTVCINTAQAVGIAIHYLGILVEFH